MVNRNDIDSFLHYNYIPFNKAQCIKRLLLTWIMSASVCFIGTHNTLWFVSIGILSIIISIFYVLLIIKLSTSMASRFLCDGVFSFYLSIILNLASYRFIVLNTGEDWRLLVLLLTLLFVCILFFALAVFCNLKQGKYSACVQNRKLAFLPFVGGACGLLAAKTFLQGESSETAINLVAIILLLLSFITSIGSLNLFKVLIMKLSSTGDGSVCDVPGDSKS